MSSIEQEIGKLMNARAVMFSHMIECADAIATGAYDPTNDFGMRPGDFALIVADLKAVDDQLKYLRDKYDHARRH